MVLQRFWTKSGLVLLRRVLWEGYRLSVGSVVAAGERFLCATASYRRVEGINVGVVSDEAAEQYWEKVADALALIRSLDPKRFERIRRDVERVLVLPARNPQFWTRRWTCMLDEALVRNRSAALVASAVVHEATHARLQRAGIRVWPDLIVRIEARCTREEIAFASRLPRDRFPSTDNFIQYLRQRGHPQTGP